MLTFAILGSAHRTAHRVVFQREFVVTATGRRRYCAIVVRSRCLEHILKSNTRGITGSEMANIQTITFMSAQLVVKK